MYTLISPIGPHPSLLSDRDVSYQWLPSEQLFRSLLKQLLTTTDGCCTMGKCTYFNAIKFQHISNCIFIICGNIVRSTKSKDHHTAIALIIISVGYLVNSNTASQNNKSFRIRSPRHTNVIFACRQLIKSECKTWKSIENNERSTNRHLVVCKLSAVINLSRPSIIM